MLNLSLLCVGKLKEKEYTALQDEYCKRLRRFCRCELSQIEEQRLPSRPSEAQIRAALQKEGESIAAKIPKGAYTIALCVEGNQMESTEFSKKLEDIALTTDKLCFIVGGSFGLDAQLKRAAQLQLSFSNMTFPHHLFRIMLLEQIYRAFTIQAGTEYHK